MLIGGVACVRSGCTKPAPPRSRSTAAASNKPTSVPLGQPIWSWSYRREAEHFVDQVRAGEPFRSSGEDTLADVKLFEAIYRAYLEQRVIG